MPNEKSPEKAQAGSLYYEPTGSNIRVNYVWESETQHAALVKVGETDIQKEIDEAAKGMTTGAQIRRILRGDTSAIQPGEGLYADVSDFPESEIDTLNVGVQARSKVEAAARDNGMTYEEMEMKINEIAKELAAKKAAEPSEPKQETPKEEAK